jgi:hypothetical protein
MLFEMGGKIEGDIQMKSYFGLYVNCSSLLANLNVTFVVCSAWLVGASCNVSFRLVQWKARYRRTPTSASKYIALHY